MACPPDCIDEYSDPRRFREAVISLLNCILDANQEGVRYDWEFLCDPSDGSTVVVRYSYEEDGTLISVDAFLPDGSPYAGAINDLVPCLDEGLVNTVLLCDLDEYGDVISPFLAHVKITTGAPASITFTEVDSVTPYVIVGTAGACSTGSGGGGGGGVGSTTLLLCDVSGGTPTQFLRRIDVDSAAVVVITDTTLDGTTPYVTAGTVGRCEDPDPIQILLLCDVIAGSPTQFLRRIEVDESGTVTVTDTTLDGSTPYVTSGTVGRCEDPDPLQILLLCDVIAGSPTQFLRRIEVDESGTVTVTDTTLDGSTPYVTSGTVGRCEDPDPFFMFLLCDVIAGSPTQFLRRIEVDESGTVTITDTTLDGSTPYVTSGTVGKCEESTLNTAALCDSDDGTVFLRHYIFIENAFDSFFDTDLAGVTYAVVGTAEACDQPNDILKILCDSDDGTRFLRRFVVSSDGTVETTDTELDGTTGYTLVGDAVVCTEGVSAQTLCDVDTYGDQIAQFTRVWDSDGTFTDFEMDGSTPYTPTGTVEECCCEAQTENVAPVTTVSSGSGSTTAGRQRVVITNTGGATGTVNGAALVADGVVEYIAYYDEEDRQMKRIASISWDATTPAATTFRIDETP